MSKREKTGITHADDPRKTAAKEFYRSGGPDFKPGNAFQSLLAAGYSRATAKSNCHLFARKVNASVQAALRAQGHDEHSQAAKLIKLTEAKLSRWNSAAEAWDEFEDNHTQLAATQEINKIFDEYPAPKDQPGNSQNIQIIFPVNFSDAMSKESAGD